MKDVINGLVKRCRIFEYTKDNKRYEEDSLKSKSSSKIVNIVTSGKEASIKEEETHKRKRQHIMAIT